MTNRAFGAAALAACLAAGPFVSPAAAQTDPRLPMARACSDGLLACAKAARQALGGNAGANAVLNAAAAAASAAAGQPVNPAVYGAPPMAAQANPVAAIAASQRYGQCVQAAGTDAQAAQACLGLLPPEWSGMARSAQNAALANPALAAQAAQAAARNNALAAGALAGGPAHAAQMAYVMCVQSAGLNLAAAAACAQPAQQAYGGFPGAAYPVPTPGFNPVDNANAVAGAAGGYQACVMAVGVTNAAGVQACQQRFLSGR